MWRVMAIRADSIWRLVTYAGSSAWMANSPKLIAVPPLALPDRLGWCCLRCLTRRGMSTCQPSVFSAAVFSAALDSAAAVASGPATSATVVSGATSPEVTATVLSAVSATGPVDDSAAARPASVPPAGVAGRAGRRWGRRGAAPRRGGGPRRGRAWTRLLRGAASGAPWLHPLREAAPSGVRAPLVVRRGVRRGVGAHGLRAPAVPPPAALHWLRRPSPRLPSG